MPINIREFKSKNAKQLLAGGQKGATKARILGFLSKSRRKAYLGTEIYRGAGYKGKARPSGDFYSQLKALVRERKVVKKGSYYTLR